MAPEAWVLISGYRRENFRLRIFCVEDEKSRTLFTRMSLLWMAETAMHAIHSQWPDWLQAAPGCRSQQMLSVSSFPERSTGGRIRVLGSRVLLDFLFLFFQIILGRGFRPLLFAD